MGEECGDILGQASPVTTSSTSILLALNFMLLAHFCPKTVFRHLSLVFWKCKIELSVILILVVA